MEFRRLLQVYGLAGLTSLSVALGGACGSGEESPPPFPSSPAPSHSGDGGGTPSSMPPTDSGKDSSPSLPSPPSPLECPGTDGPPITCAWLQSSDNCWASMLKTLSACIPQLGTLASDRSGCTFAGGETTTFSPPLANAPLALGETITWTTTDGDGGVCVAGVAKFLADRSVVALRSGGACVSQNYDASGGYISCGGVRRKVDAAALAACGGAGSAGRNTVFKAGIDAYWGTNGLGKIPGEPQTVLRCQ